MLEFEMENTSFASIKVVGVGGAGGNALEEASAGNGHDDALLWSACGFRAQSGPDGPSIADGATTGQEPWDGFSGKISCACEANHI